MRLLCGVSTDLCTTLSLRMQPMKFSIVNSTVETHRFEGEAFEVPTYTVPGFEASAFTFSGRFCHLISLFHLLASLLESSVSHSTGKTASLPTSETMLSAASWHRPLNDIDASVSLIVGQCTRRQDRTLTAGGRIRSGR